MTQSNLSSILGVPNSTISRWENGEVRPSCEYLGELYDFAYSCMDEEEIPDFFVPPKDDYVPSSVKMVKDLEFD